MLAHPKGNLLLIEDDARFQENLSVVFRVAGYETLFATTAEEGFSALETYQVDLIILDYMLPVMDGMQFFQRLVHDRRYMELVGLPVVIMTGYPLAAKEYEQFKELGAKAIMTKGTGFKDLVHIIDQEVEAYKTVRNFEQEANRNFSLPEYLAYVEKQIILRALIKHPESSQEVIARQLGIPRSTLSRKMSDYQLRIR